MSPDDLSNLLKDEITDAIAYIDGSDWISGERKQNLDFYRGDMANYLPAAKGTSQVVDTVVADYIDMMMPDLIRPFTAGKVIAEFEAPENAEEFVNKVVTPYINGVVFRKDNNGELIVYNWFKDALIQKVGITKAYWHERQEIKRRTYSGLNDLELYQAVATFGQGAITNYTQAPDGHSIQVEQAVRVGKVQIDNIPPEEFIISRNARTLEDAIWKGHRIAKRVGDLVADGYDPATIDELPDYNPQQNGTTSNDPRYRDREAASISNSDPMLREVVIHEGILRCDYYGRGLEDFYVVAGGDETSVKILTIEPYECQVVFADVCPKPMPHTFWGNCPADDLCPIQMVNTFIQRQAVTNLAYSQTPQRVVVQDAIVFPDQLSSLAPNQSILVKPGYPNAVTPLTTPFMGQAGVEMMQFFDQRAEQRAGVSRASSGLDPDQLANQSATAAALAWSVSVGRRDLIARIFAWGGVRKLFKGIFKILVKYQNFERIANIGGKQIPVDPRMWEQLGDLDVIVTTGLGTGHRDRDVAFLTQIYGVQEKMLMTMGPSPIVDFGKLSHTLQKAVEAAGISNPQSYFGDVPQGWAPQMPERPDPAMEKVKVAAMEAQARMQLEAQKTEQEKAKNAVELQTKRDVAAVDLHTQREIAASKAQIDTEQMLRKADLEREKMLLNDRLERERLEMEAELELKAIKAKAPEGNGNIPNSG